MGRGCFRGGTTGATAPLSGFTCVSQAVNLSQPGIVIPTAVAQARAVRVEGETRQNGNIDVSGVDYAARKLGGHGLERARRLAQTAGKSLQIGQLGDIHPHECQSGAT